METQSGSQGKERRRCNVQGLIHISLHFLNAMNGLNVLKIRIMRRRSEISENIFIIDGGGGWYDPPDRLKSSRRMYAGPANRADDVGFRCAGDLAE